MAARGIIVASQGSNLMDMGKQALEGEGEHCLDPNIQHVKGCWVVDWVLGKA